MLTGIVDDCVEGDLDMCQQPFNSRLVEEVGGVLNVAGQCLIVEKRQRQIALRGLCIDLVDLDCQIRQRRWCDGRLKHELNLKQRIATAIAFSLDSIHDQVERCVLMCHCCEH